MLLTHSTRFHRRAMASITSAAVAMALVVAGAAPARGQECTPGMTVDFCGGVVPGGGFLLDKGVFTFIQAPGASLTIPFGINNHGQIAGVYHDDEGIIHGVLLSSKGEFTTFDAPDAVGETALFDLNNRGRVIGGFVDAT